jgi:hypothetical protein
MALKYFVRIPDQFVNLLKDKPETGMGYHVVDVTLKNGVTLFHRIIFNGSELKLWPDEDIKGTDIKEITTDSKLPAV